MEESEKIYRFAGLVFRPAMRKIEVEQTQESITLTPILSNLLLALVQKAGDVATYDELRIRVWPHEPRTSSRVRHTMQVTKGQLIKLLETVTAVEGIIESQPGRGYRLNAEVTLEVLAFQVLIDDSEEPLTQGAAVSTALADNSPSLRTDGFLGSHPRFVVMSSVLYGTLFWVAMLLEAAYQFDVYGNLALVFGFAAMLMNSIALGSVLVVGEHRARNRRKVVFFGCGILLAGVLGSALLASICLPNAPVTLTKLQAQPAFAAFLKNALVYILPVGMFAVFIPFYFVVSQRLKVEKNIESLPPDALFITPNALLVVCLATLVYSLVTTFYLLDNLQTGVYHGLFVTLVFLRFFMFFGLILGSLFWYRATLNNIAFRSA